MFIGVDIGGTNIKIGLVDENGAIIRKDSMSTGVDPSYQEIVRDIAQLSHRLIQDAGIGLQDVQSIGIGCPGAVDDHAGMLMYMPNISFRNVPLRQDLQALIDAPVHLGNDANCAALAEAMVGAAREADISVTITLGTGIGGGIIINRQIYTGFNHIAGELGHLVIMVDGEQCGCGRRGCFEAYASVTGLIRMTRQAIAQHPDSAMAEMIKGDLNRVSGKTSFDAAKAGDPAGQAVVDQYIQYLAEGVANIIMAFQPQVFVIGGGISKEGDYLLNPLNRLLDERNYCDSVPQTQVRIAQFGNDAGIIGAAMIGR